MQTLSNTAIKKKQQQILALIIIAFCTILFGLYTVFIKSKAPTQKAPATKKHLLEMKDIFDEQNILYHEIRQHQSQTEAEIKRLNTLVNALKNAPTDHKPTQQNNELAILKVTFADLQARYEHGINDIKALSHDLLKKQSLPQAPLPISITPVTATLNKPQSKTLANYIPAGTHVKAVIIGSVDAGAGVTAQSEQKPMILRVVGRAILPNYQEKSLNGCSLIAKSYGDISSERIYARLHTLSCVNQSGTILETPVKGNLFGPSGKYGIRGRVIRRESDMLEHAALYGLVSGITNGISQQFMTQSVSPLGSTQTIDHNEAVKYAFANSANSALAKLADYHIKRAEQYQPVIQVDAGITVDIIFTEGFSTAPKPPPLTASTTIIDKKEVPSQADPLSTNMPSFNQEDAISKKIKQDNITKNINEVFQ